MDWLLSKNLKGYFNKFNLYSRATKRCNEAKSTRQWVPTRRWSRIRNSPKSLGMSRKKKKKDIEKGNKELLTGKGWLRTLHQTSWIHRVIINITPYMLPKTGTKLSFLSIFKPFEGKKSFFFFFNRYNIFWSYVL